ncbi:spermidine synthase [Fulvimarina endophytica]|uniref:Spermidine synthase n=1 Tax=Fulvimarina endophytica TaxID=2293836 RepID=A0A371X168_9HYPH|nr:spermidine synthase [Fulvimarina endophytica]RFC62973.1 spermidine synthase [Fulvimarina endophytica]
MKPWVHLASAEAPDGDTLRLLRRGDEFSIQIARGNELMNSRLGGSEEALADLSLDRLAERPPAHILVGGLGMGFTLRAVLGRLGPAGRVTVSEIVPELAGWARREMADVFGDCLDDPRVEIRLGDVAAHIREAGASYDAILLDVDNGPDGLTREGNDALYTPAGLSAAKNALRPGGILAVWSAAMDDGFTRRMRAAGFKTEVEKVHAGRSKRGPKHVIWIGTRTA